MAPDISSKIAKKELSCNQNHNSWSTTNSASQQTFLCCKIFKYRPGISYNADMSAISEWEDISLLLENGTKKRVGIRRCITSFSSPIRWERQSFSCLLLSSSTWNHSSSFYLCRTRSWRSRNRSKSQRIIHSVFPLISEQTQTLECRISEQTNAEALCYHRNG